MLVTVGIWAAGLGVTVFTLPAAYGAGMFLMAGAFLIMGLLPWLAYRKLVERISRRAHDGEIPVLEDSGGCRCC